MSCASRYKHPVRSRYTSIKTRIETRPRQASSASSVKPLATLPSKQGLKLDTRAGYWSRGRALATLPSKQGLKPDRVKRQARQASSSRYTSIKTRIETAHDQIWFRRARRTLATLPSKQGLKRGYTILTGERGSLSLHFHQNKD